jgi:2-methylisocitrate lyase-like PEP mutase family enzyme
MVGFVQRLRLAFPQQHRLVDIDDGYVDPEVACHVVEHLERIGASGVILEEQTRPRRCGHVTGKHILPIEEYLEKLNLVLQTRSELVVVARTDVTEESEILRRAEMLAATDADVLLVDGVGKQGAGHFPMLLGNPPAPPPPGILACLHADKAR